MRLNVARRISPPLRFVPPRLDPGALSPIASLSLAWDETLRLLFRPFLGRRWVALSVVCLFLGGGTSTAAFQWGFGVLPIDFQPSDLLLRLRQGIAQHLSLIVLATVLSLSVVLGLIYVRCVLRFILIEAVIKHDISIGEAWKRLQASGRSYFLWLVGLVGSLATLAFTAMIGSFYLLNLLEDGSHPWWIDSLVLVAELVAVVFGGLLAAILITLTDDLVAPLMYADRLSLPRAWKIIWKIWRRDPGWFYLYVVLRFLVSMGISIAVLLVLFPVLMGLSSGALVASALVIFALRVVGLTWTWNPVTIIIGAAGLIILTGLLFAVLSVAGMPGQVYLQNYGIRFIASRIPSLGELCRASASSSRRR